MIVLHERLRWSHVFMLVASAALLLGGVSRVFASSTSIWINEIRIDQSGTDNDEYFELATGGASVDLTGLTYLVIGEGTGAGSGVIEAVVALPSTTFPANDFFVCAEPTFTLGTPDYTTAASGLNFENGDNTTHLLVQGFSGALNDDLDTNDDGVLDSTPWTQELDRVAVIGYDNPPPSGQDWHYGPPAVGPGTGLSLFPYHVCRAAGSWYVGAEEVGAGDTPGAANPAPSANEAPVAVADSAVVNQDTTLTVAAPGVLSNDSDDDDDPLTAIRMSWPTHGTLQFNADGGYVYAPDAGYAGPDEFTYRAHDGTEGSNIVAVTLTVRERTALARTSGSTTVNYGSTFTLRGKLTGAGGAPLGGQQVKLESSGNGSSFSATAITATTASDGTFSMSMKPGAKTWYRARFAETDTCVGCVMTSAAIASVRPSVGTPVAPRTMRRTRSYTIYGYLKPRHTAGTYPVRIYKWKRTSTGKWKSYGYVTARASNYSSYSKYARKIRLKSRGKWRLRAYAPADSGHVAVWSGGYDYVTVK